MTSADHLVAWLDEIATATIERHGDTIRLAPTDVARARWCLGEPVVSRSRLTNTSNLLVTRRRREISAASVAGVTCLDTDE